MPVSRHFLDFNKLLSFSFLCWIVVNMLTQRSSLLWWWYPVLSINIMLALRSLLLGCSCWYPMGLTVHQQQYSPSGRNNLKTYSTSSVVEWLARLPRVWSIMDSSHGRVKLKTIKLVFVASPLSMQHSGVRTKTYWFGIRIMCPCGATCLPVVCMLFHYSVS